MERITNFPNEAKEIRLRHKRVRDEMSKECVIGASTVICEGLCKLAWYETCNWIYGYYPLGNEVDCLPFLRKALSDGKHIALPKMEHNKLQGNECRMDFYEVTSLNQVEKGMFGVFEPDQTCSIVQREDAIVLVPGVVFDGNGNRYGYGKGYYDRYFARYPKMYKLALAYEHQLEEKLFVSETDVKMDVVYTEHQCYRCTERMGEQHGTIGNM